MRALARCGPWPSRKILSPAAVEAALVTKTFGAAAMDLAFFLMLFMIVHTIYSFVGCIM